MSTSLTLEDIKKIDQESKDVIYGYVKGIQKLFPADIVYFTIPTLVIHWVLLYHYIGDQIDDSKLSEQYALSCENTVITVQTGRISDFVPFQKVVENGIHQWKFKILKVNEDRLFMTLGIAKANIEIYCDRVDNFKERDGYGWMMNCNTLTNWTSYTKGNKVCVSGDIIGMILNLNAMTLSYIVNDEDWGVAYDDIEQTAYRAVVSANCKGDAIQFISYEQIE